MTRAQISLVICSKNRAEALQNCLLSIRSEEMLEVSGELVLVDNGSTDNTFEVTQQFRQSCNFPAKVVRESKVGLAHARNAGLNVASGKIIAMTDDDCYLPPGYLKAVVSAFATTRFSYCGGRILRYDPEDLRYVVNYGQELRLISPGSFITPGTIQGANMAFSRAVLDRIGGFDTMFGSGALFHCEDIDYCARASMAGFWGAHVPSIVIYHHHRRKADSNESKEWQMNHAYARGAYYMKFMLLGKLNYWKGWMQTTRSYKKFRPDLIRRELNGALDYLIERMKMGTSNLISQRIRKTKNSQVNG